MSNREIGRNCSVWVGPTEGAAPVKVPYVATYTLDSTTEKIDVTAAGDKNKVYRTTLPDFAGSITGFVDTDQLADDDALWTASRDGKPRHTRIYRNEDAAKAGVAATVSNKALTNNVATLTTSTAHGLKEGQWVTVAGVDATFNGTHLITAVPSATTFQFKKTAADVPSAVATGTATGPNTSAHFYGEVLFDLSEEGGVAAAMSFTASFSAAGNVYRTP